MDEFLNFHQYSDTIGTAGQPTAELFQQIAEAGYSAVINLAMHDSDNAVAEEGNIVASLGMCYVHIPVPFEKPTAQHLKKFIGVMEALDGESVFVHCAVNARVSAFMYKYLTLKKGVPTDEATSPLLKQWRPRMNEAWQEIMNLGSTELGL